MSYYRAPARRPAKSRPVVGFLTIGAQAVIDRLEAAAVATADPERENLLRRHVELIRIAHGTGFPLTVRMDIMANAEMALRARETAAT